MFGVNLNSFNTYSDNRLFLNICKQAAPWSPDTDSASITVGEDGYPESIQSGAALSVACQSDLYARNVRYVLTWDGEGTITLNGTDKTTTANRIEFTYTAAALNLKITAIPDPLDKPRNFRLVEKIYENSTDLFYPPILQAMKAFPFSVYRFMDATKTNNSDIETAADAPKLNAYTYSVDGAPVEFLVELCNEQKVAGWFCMPHKATDAYVESVAQYIADNMDTALEVYIEHSNEVWNPQFTQSNYCVVKGQEFGLNIIPNRQNTGTIVADTRGAMRYHLKRTVEIGNIFKANLTDHKVNCVLGARTGVGQASFYLDLDPGLATQIDSFAVAPYFGNEFGKPEDEEVQELWSSEDVINQLDQVLKDNRINRMESTLSGLVPYNIPLITYEAGQHLVGKKAAQNNVSIAELFNEVNRHPGMEQFYKTYIQNWQQVAGKDSPLMFFSWITAYSKYGSWGLSDRLSDITISPKSKAIIGEAKTQKFFTVVAKGQKLIVYVDVPIHDDQAIFNRETVTKIEVFVNAKKRGSRVATPTGWKSWQVVFKVNSEPSSLVEVVITTSSSSYTDSTLITTA